jgi:arylsulfatase A-like enzyme
MNSECVHNRLHKGFSRLSHSRRALSVVFVYSAAAFAAVGSETEVRNLVQPTENPPNILLIMADDLGWGDVSCYGPGSPIRTPHIDRLAKEGIQITNAHAPAAACTPTRYGLLTGRYPWRSYVKKGVLKFYAPAMITKNHLTLPSLLRSHNYRTAGFGKWHTGLDWTPVEGDPARWRSHWNSEARDAAVTVGRGIDHARPFGNAPTDIGFDRYFGTPSNAGRLPFFIEDNRVVGNPKPDKKGLMRDPALARDKVDDIYVDKAIRFIRSHQQDHSDRPFFVYLPLNAIHGAVEVPERFQGTTKMTIREDKIPWVNENVGEMLDALDEMNLTKDTLVIFTSDNGPLNSPEARAAGHQPTGPYRGVKSNVWDGGTRVPFLARWPGHIPAGATSDHLACLTDMLATFAELCGDSLRQEDFPDSVSLFSVLRQKDSKAVRDNLVTLSFGGFLTIRQGRWKAVFGTKWTGGHHTLKYGGERPKSVPPDSPEIGQLFDISQDPFEKNDVWEEHPEVVENLRGELERIKALIADDPKDW